MTDLLIDTNSLVLYILGSTNPNYLKSNRKHARISAFDQRHYDLINGLIQTHDRLITSPNVWTEVDNLCTNYIHGDDKYTYINIMKVIINQSVEKYIETKESISDPTQFYHIGITDSIILKLAESCKTLITADSMLADFARSRSITVIDMKQIATQDALSN